ncbi:MAG TPA: prolyl oligopeptidase family serine peptidase [Verrucomicrobiae bacterium]|nr:prolyl oligopeptidase family serine peptidase [Verrucomicrobiae bacterium]
MNFRPLAVTGLLGLAVSLHADGPKDNIAENVRRVPPPGIAIGDSDRAELESGAADLGREIESLRNDLKNKPALLDLLPDVQIFHNAVRYALAYNEFYRTNEVETARGMLLQGKDRASLLRQGKTPWATATGLVVRGYRSKIDGSVQPYGLVVPASFQPNPPRSYRLDFWFHGRGENLTELSFLNDRERNPGEFTPPNAFVLHLYGRYCNANRFAGEMDLFEAYDHARKHYPIDENRLVVRGFSMGGAACWQFATHYAGLWAAAAPGAGFSETADFLKVFQKETLKPAWFEQKLWHMYDSTDYALNLYNCPTVVYSGEIDSQKEAADMMDAALKKEGIEMVHIIGPKTPHRYHPDSKIEINRRIDSIAGAGRNPVPKEIKFTTWTLRYNQMGWVTVDGLEQHWERARVDAELDAPNGAIKVATRNVSALTLDLPAGRSPFDVLKTVRVSLDGQRIVAGKPFSDRSWTAHFRRDGNRWKLAKNVEDGSLQKRHGLQGPIDDAFFDSFLMVSPTGTPMNAKVGAWTKAEMDHAVDHWRRQFRGEARVKADKEITDADVAANNLVLWGDPMSNQILARIADKLPVRWNAQGLQAGSKSYGADHFVPVMIFPNPLNPKRYVVLNSGFTFREYDYLNNARQTPKLPDYAIVDIDSPVTPRWPGGIADAGFFDEQWRLPKK